MGTDDKNVEIAMEPVPSLGVTASGDVTGDVGDDEYRSILKQTRTRRLFSTSQLFSFMLVYFGTWFVVAGNIFFAIQNGGPRGWFISYFVVCLGVMCQLLPFAEMASLQPVAGAQYYWTWSFTSPRYRKFATWIQGWVTWLGYVALLASVANGGVVNLHGLISLGWKGEEPYTATGWHTTLIYIGWVLILTLINMYAFWLVPWVELIAGIINVIFFFACVVIVWVLAPRNTMEVFSIVSEGSGWDTFTSFNVGSLSSVFYFIGFESLVHLGEETKNPRRAVPASMFWGLVTNMFLGLIMIFTFGIALPPVDDILNSVSPLTAILLHATGSATITIVIQSGVFVVYCGAVLGNLSTVSRLTWAWARDGGLPKYFAIVDAKTRVPERAVWATSIIVCLLSFLNLNDEAFIALGAITSLTTLGLYCSYAIVLSSCLYSRLANPDFLKESQWHIGKTAGMMCNVFGLIYTVYEIIWLPFPALLPVTAANMNYAGPVFGAVVLFALSWWFVWAKQNWAGPNLRVVEFVLKSDAASATSGR